jgi:hypothetical protein
MEAQVETLFLELYLSMISMPQAGAEGEILLQLLQKGLR